MKRKLFTKVLLTLTMLFGLSGVANAQDLKRDSPEIVKLAKEDLKVLSNSFKISDEKSNSLYELFLEKNVVFENQKHFLSPERKKLMKKSFSDRIQIIIGELLDLEKDKGLVRFESILENVGLNANSPMLDNRDIKLNDNTLN